MRHERMVVPAGACARGRCWGRESRRSDYKRQVSLRQDTPVSSGIFARFLPGLGPHVFEVDRLLVDAAQRRRDVVGELARLVHRARPACSSGSPCRPADGSHSSRRRCHSSARDRLPRRDRSAGRRRRRSARLNLRSGSAKRKSMPCAAMRLFQRSTPLRQSSTYQSRSTSLSALRIGTSCRSGAPGVDRVEQVDVAGEDVIVLVLVLLRPPLQTVGEVGGGVARHLAAVQVEALAEPEVDVLLDRRQVDAADFPHVLREARSLSSAGTCARRCGREPVSPTNM